MLVVPPALVLVEAAAAITGRGELAIQAQCEPPDDDRWFERMRASGIDTLGMHLEAVTPEVRERILNAVWGYDHPIETRVIDVHIRNLRRKIESQPSRPYYILAVPGIGYRFTNARPG